jgi:hypothetical protein
MSQSRPASREELKKYCLIELGYPVIKVNVDDAQLENCVDKTLQFYQEFHSAGTERSYLKHQVTAGDISNNYIQMADSVATVIRIFPVGGTNAAMGMFDLRYQLRLNDLWDLSSTSYVNYAITMQHLRTLDMIFSGETPVDFNYNTGKLNIFWDWTHDIQAGEWIIAEAFVVVDPVTYTKVWNDRMVKELATAYVKQAWGQNLGKFAEMPLPGGIKVNGQIIEEKATADIERIKLEVRKTYEAPPAFIVG